MTAKAIRILPVLLAFAGVVSARAAETLVVAQGVTSNLTTYGWYEAEEIHGTLNVFRSVGTDTVGIENLKSAAACSLGTGAGDAATITVGDYGHIWGGVFTVGGSGSTGSFVAGGKRPGDVTGTSDSDHAHLALGGINLATNATSDTGVVDVLRLNAGAAVGLVPEASRQRLVNASPSADMRLLFNGGWFAVFNAVASTYLFTTVSNALHPEDVPEGLGGRAIVLEGFDGHAVDVRIAGGDTCRPCCGTVCFRGANDVCLSSTGAGEREPYGWVWDQAASGWQQTGDLRLGGAFLLRCAADDVLPCAATNGIVRVDEAAMLDLNGRQEALNGLEVAGATACLTNSSPYAAWLMFGTILSDATLSVRHAGGNGLVTALFKGSGTLSVSNTPAFPAFDIRSGTLRVTGDCRVRRLTLAAGVRVVVDGGTLTVTESLIDRGGAVTGENGGRLAVVSDSAQDSRIVLGATAIVPEIGKTGTGRLTLYAPGQIAAGVHVAAGTLAFAAPGTTNGWFRFSFTRMPAGYTGFLLSQMVLMEGDESHRRDGGGAGNRVTDAAFDCLPQDMPQPSVWASDQAWTDQSPKNLFSGNLKTKIRYGTSVDPTVPSSWKVFVVRLPARSSATSVPVTDCYNFRNGRCGPEHPSAWSLETSPDGVSWDLIDEQFDQKPGSARNDLYNGGSHYAIYAGYPGAAGLAAGSAVRVDRGAVFDATGVTGGQTLDNLTVDCSSGTGDAVFRNVHLADAGTIDVRGDLGDALRVDLPCRFEASSAPDTFDGWTVCLNGRPLNREMYRFRWSNGRLVLRFKGGALVILR